MAAAGPNKVEQPFQQSTAAPLNGSAPEFDHDIQNLAVCASPAGIADKPKRKSKRREKSSLEKGCAWIVDHQLSLSFTFMACVITSHLFIPSLRWETDKFLHLQYYDEKSGLYGKGWDDMFFVLSWIMIFFGARVAFMEYLAAPFAKWANIKGRKEHIRFAEQAWIVLYDGGMWSLGFYIIYNSEYWLNLDGMWTNWPMRRTDGLMKAYYLIQFAFWLQQIVVVNIEERRKDHWQMLTHHLVTCMLMFTSYAWNHTKPGNVILCLMDFVDILLSFAKMLRYLGLQFACDCAFGVFIVGWIITRHILFNMVWWSVYARLPVVLKLGCYVGDDEHMVGPIEPPDAWWHLVEPIKDPNGMVCHTKFMNKIFLGLLGALQVILMIWMGMILRLAWKVIKGGESADDPRSDDEEEEESEEDFESKSETKRGKKATENGYTAVPLEEEVDADQMHFGSRTKVRSGPGSRTTSVQLPVKKELLNRVGCDTKTTK